MLSLPFVTPLLTQNKVLTTVVKLEDSIVPQLLCGDTLAEFGRESEKLKF